MSTYHCTDGNGSTAQVDVSWHRTYGAPALPAPYLVTIGIRPSLHGFVGAYPQSFAVPDDFGTLVIVERWS